MVMEKSKLEKFISRYNLAGTCESVNFVSDGNKLSVRGISEDKNVVVEVEATNMSFPKGTFCIFETKKLRGMLGVMGDNVDISPVTAPNQIVTGLNISDSSTKATFVLADPQVAPHVPDVKLPKFDTTITLDEKFTATFVRAKNALTEANNFVIMSDGETKTAQLIVGFSKLNTNRIAMDVKMDTAAKLQPVNFSANYLKEILSTHKDCVGVLSLNTNGLVVVKFVDGDFTSTYYLPKIA